jgi:hypothetical protein
VSGEGVYLILKRDDSKHLQTLTGDDAIRRFVRELRSSKAYRNEGLLVECGDSWSAIHRCLTEGTLAPEAGDFPLNHFVLGGKRLCASDDCRVVLVRPDIVPHVAESARDVKRTEFHERYLALDTSDYGRPLSEKEFDRIWSTFRQIQQLFDDAAADRAAVLFAVTP